MKPIPWMFTMAFGSGFSISGVVGSTLGVVKVSTSGEVVISIGLV